MPIDFNSLDTAIHGPIRLGAVTALYMDGPLDFTALKKHLGTTDGSLGVHLQKLEQIGYVASKKAFVGRRPKTTYRLTTRGKRAFRKYLDAMQQLLEAVEGSPR